MFKAPNYTQVPNEFFDEMIPNLKEGELRILLVIMRQTLGWKKERDRISLSQIAKKTGMERKSVCRSLKSLIELGLVEKYKTGENGEQQCWYSLQVEPVQKEEEIPDSEADLIDDSNICYQCPKDTPPSVLKTPTKETLTKEKIPKEKYKKEKVEAPPPIPIFEQGSVRMLQSAYEKLIGSYGTEMVEFTVKQLDLYSQADPVRFRKYRSHAAVIEMWIVREKKKQEKKTWTNNGSTQKKNWNNIQNSRENSGQNRNVGTSNEDFSGNETLEQVFQRLS